ncbi:hypothetical protein SZ64_08845 [Erythrobacter sp. SG61-1L]|uniref:hypothetical protein n=1 Tax=Erythrobacter sp. SG61-1L TaxID=1603897 RepID=UPI0006C916EC|nr:hypothetical protein [Erythrobacter sp. SG61-1L]KPL68220.1 hypothetical protein SZ64_08845 [Erythrobacter sp. SG61-1L]
MSQPAYASSTSLIERIRAEFGRRATGIVVALLLECIIIGLLLTLSMGKKQEVPMASVVTTFDSASDDDTDSKPDAKPEEQKPTVQPSAQPQDQPQPDPQPVPQPVVQPQPAPSPPAFVPISKNQMAQLDISNLPKAQSAAAPAKQTYGPANVGGANDSERVGTAPNGKPMYAAQWYREPTHDEMAGYLSTADGPGWGLITCRTVPEYRVDSCVALDESPDHSNIARAALAAAWQFKVRPPRLGGKYKYGEWVRIRIDYEIRRQ